MLDFLTSKQCFYHTAVCRLDNFLVDLNTYGAIPEHICTWSKTYDQEANYKDECIRVLQSIFFLQYPKHHNRQP